MSRKGKGKKRPQPLNVRQRHQRVKRLLHRDGDLCHWCKQPYTEDNPPTVDHLVELSKGGSNRDHNLVLAHGDCNNQRSNGPKKRT